jgi:hypothetical protein
MLQNQQYAVNSSGLILPDVYTSPLLAALIKTDTPQSTWHKAGYLQAVIRIDGIDFSGEWFPLVYGHQLINIPYTRYRLRYRPASWHKNYLQIKQLPKSRVNQIMPLYTTGSTIADQPVIDSIPTTFSAGAWVAASPIATYQALAANPARQTYAVTNLGTAPAYLDLDPPATATKRLVSIPANGTYVSDIPYVGAVFVWSSNATAQSIEVREFIQ